MRFSVSRKGVEAARLILALSLLAFAGFVAPAFSAGKSAVTYNLSTDFSALSNPNGVWRYGYATRLGSPFLLNTKRAHVSDLDGWEGALSSAPLEPPVVFRNKTTKSVNYLTISLRPEEVAVHPGPNGEYGVVRWITPRTAIYTFRVTFSGADTHGTTTDVHVLFGQRRVFGAAVTGFKRNIRFSQSTQLKKGTSVDFAVGYGQDRDYHYDSTGLAVTISQR